MMRPMTALLAPIKVCGDTGDRDLYRPIMYLQSGMFGCALPVGVKYIHKHRAILACTYFLQLCTGKPTLDIRMAKGENILRISDIYVCV